MKPAGSAWLAKRLCTSYWSAAGGDSRLPEPHRRVEDEFELIPDPMLSLSNWSNLTRVSLGKEEVTIDFAIQDPQERTRGSLIARITLPPGAAFDLRDTLVEVMRTYTERGQPPLEGSDGLR